jgi:hypothetical protein
MAAFLRSVWRRALRALDARSAWLSITPEPERELPRALATLAAGGRPGPDAVVAEALRLERIVVGAARRSWMDYLHRGVSLIESQAASEEPDVIRARARAAAVIVNHHNLLLGLAGKRSATAEADCRRLADLGLTDASEASGRGSSDPARGSRGVRWL